MEPIVEVYAAHEPQIKVDSARIDLVKNMVY